MLLEKDPLRHSDDSESLPSVPLSFTAHPVSMDTPCNALLLDFRQVHSSGALRLHHCFKPEDGAEWLVHRTKMKHKINEYFVTFVNKEWEREAVESEPTPAVVCLRSSLWCIHLVSGAADRWDVRAAFSAASLASSSMGCRSPLGQSQGGCCPKGQMSSAFL